MSRIAGVQAKSAGLVAKFAYWYSRRRTGKVMEPAQVTAHNTPILLAAGGYEYWLERAHTVDLRLKVLAELKAAALVGCPF